MDGALLHYGDPLHYSIFDYVCIASAGIVPLFALLGPFKAWRTHDLGAAGRRPEPTLSALVGNASWLLFGWTETLVEPLGLNLWGGGFQIPGLLVFFWLCTPAERRRTLRVRGPICVPAIYLALLAGFGVSHHINLGLYQCLCTGAGMVAAAAPLVTFIFLTENASQQLLPGWITLGFSAIHGLLWFVRGVILNNHYMLLQNLAGFVCSAFQLAIKLVGPLLDIYDGVDFGEELLVDLPVIQPTVDIEQGLPRIPPSPPAQVPPTADIEQGQGLPRIPPSPPAQVRPRVEEKLRQSDEDKDDDEKGKIDDRDGGSTGGQSVQGQMQPPAAQDATSSGTPGVSSGKDVPRRRSSRLALASNKTPSKPTMVASNKTPSKPTPTMVASNKTPSKPTPTMVASNKTPSKLTMVLRSSTTRNTPTSGSESSSTTPTSPPAPAASPAPTRPPPAASPAPPRPTSPPAPAGKSSGKQ